MRIAVISDDESVREKVGRESADVLIACGDLSDAVILDVARVLGARHVLAVKGNHDAGGPFPAPIIDLHLNFQTIDGVTFGGFQGAWRYKPRGHFLYEQSEVEQFLGWFPRVDVFVAHNSPRNIHDRNDFVHTGFEAFGRYIERTAATLFLHGHQHVNRETTVGTTRVVGVYGHARLEFPLRSTFALSNPCSFPTSARG